MRPVVTLLGGIALIAVGLLWTLQGLGIVPGSVMTGVTLWAVIGPLVAAAGIGLIIWSRRRRRP